VPDDEVVGMYRICHYGARKLAIREAEILMRSVLDKLGFKGTSFILWAFSSSLEYLWNTLSLNSWEYINFSGCNKSFCVEKLLNAN